MARVFITRRDGRMTPDHAKITILRVAPSLPSNPGSEKDGRTVAMPNTPL